MIGAGIAAGSLAGGNTNAARVSLPPQIEIESIPAAPALRVAAAAVTEIPKAHQPGQAAREAAPAIVVAARFPASWGTAQQDAGAPAQRALAYAAEPDTSPPTHAAPVEPAEGGYSLASVDPAPPPLPRARAVRPAPPRNPELFNDAQLASIKLRLRLTPQQEHYWPPVEKALRAISFKAAQQTDARRPVRGAPAAGIDPNSAEVQQLKSAAFPLIMSLREDQKREVRQLAHTMGLSKVAAMF
jgi:hypothetical protein